MIDFSTLLFFIRNGNRAQDGEGGRSLVAVGQGAKLVKQICTCDSIFAKGTQSAVNAFKTLAKEDKVFNCISKGVKFASENVNPLIVVSSGINVLKSDDKQSAVITEAGNLAGMFAIEGWMKKHLDDIIAKLPVSKKWQPVVRGISFVTGSIGVSTIGSKAGSVVAAKLKTENEKAQAELSQEKIKTSQMLQAEQKNDFAPRSLAYSA